MEAEDLTKTDGHIRVAGEVEIDIQRNGNAVHPVEKDGLFVSGVDQLAEIVHGVCDQHLFGKTQNKAARALACHGEAVGAVLQLSGNVCVADDRTCDELGEHGNVSRQIDGVFLCLLTAVNVNHVADDLEGVEADTDGKYDLEQGNGKPCDGIEVINEEIHVLEVQHKGYDTCHRQTDKQLCDLFLAVFLDQQTEAVSESYGKHHKTRVFHAAPGVEEQAEDQQNCVLELGGHEEIQKDNCGDKEI